MFHPLISVIMPCYNSRATLPMALASLLAQHYDNWELVFVNDGSTDGSADVVAAVNDPRFRIIRLDRNYGRGVARQRGNEAARGAFIAMLDADDWWYTTKLEQQVRFLLEHQEISLVGTGMIIVNHLGTPVGFRSCRKIDQARKNDLKPPPLAYATVLMRKTVSTTFSYNPQYRLAQDVDFLQRVCLQEYFANLPVALYVYTEYQTYRISKVIQAFRYRIQGLKQFSDRYPWQARKEITKFALKIGIYSLAHLIGLGNYMLARRSSPVSEEMVAQHRCEEKAVHAIRDRFIGTYL